jgi:Protein of unknown function (DUF1062)
MHNILQVRWTITPKIAPQPWVTCSGCGCLRAFASSDKIRLNANGRKLDAWLIYKCTICNRTWNRTIFERRHVRDVDAAALEALQSNDPDWIRAEAFNLEALKEQVSTHRRVCGVRSPKGAVARSCRLETSADRVFDFLSGQRTLGSLARIRAAGFALPADGIARSRTAQSEAGANRCFAEADQEWCSRKPGFVRRG